MDSSKKPFTAVEWCAGYAGIHLGLKRAIPNLRVIAFSEIEAFACANLVAKMEAGLLDPAPIWTNLKTFPSAAFANKVDLLVAGYPCQPFSAAGKRLGTEDERHLWPHIASGIRVMRPRFCFFENVEGHITLGLSTVISDLAEMGYKTTWGIFSASEVGAPHQRKRVFILAMDNSLRNGYGSEYTLSTGGYSIICPSSDELANRSHHGHQCRPGSYTNRELSLQGQQTIEARDYTRSGEPCRCSNNLWPSRPGQPQYEWEPPRTTVLADDSVSRSDRGADRISRGEREQDKTVPDAGEGRGREDGLRQTQPPLGGDLNGGSDRLDHAELYKSCDNRVDELRLLGNGVVPKTVTRAWEVLWARLNND